MKNLLKTAIIIAGCTFVFSANCFAQNAKKSFKTDVSLNELNLSNEQKALFKVSKDHREAARNEFKASLSAEQEAIMIDKSLTKEEKRAKLAASLTLAQKQKQESNKAIAKDNRLNFIKSLSLEQKKAFKSMSQNWRDKHRVSNKDLETVKEDELMFK